MHNFILRWHLDGTLSWTVDRDGILPAQGSLAEAAKALAGQPLTVLIPVLHTSLLQTRLPGKQKRIRQQALPYLLEEQLAADIETLHIASGKVENGEIPCAAIDRQWLQNLLGELHAANMHPALLTVDALALPWQAGSWTLLIEPDGILLRTARHSGMACTGESLMQLVELLGHAGLPEKICLHDMTAGTNLQDTLQAWCRQQGVQLEILPPPAHALTLLASTLATASPPNLLQGEFSPREQHRQLWRPWRLAAGLLLASLVLQTGMATSQYLALKKEDAQLAVAIETLYRDTFPEARRVVNAPVQMQQQLAGLRQGGASSEFHTYLQHAAAELQRSKVKILSLHYSDGQLEMECSAESLQNLEQLRKQLDRPPVHAEISAADQGSAGHTARLALRGTGP